jgi:hypothetical protein
MTRFTDRVTRDLHQIADRSTPSSTAWDSIRTRIDEQTDQPPTMEVIMLSPDRNDSPKRGWMLAAAAVAGLALVGGLVFATTRSDDTVPADSPTATLPAEPAPDAELSEPLVFEGTYASQANTFKSQPAAADGGAVPFVSSSTFSGDLIGQRAVVGTLTSEPGFADGQPAGVAVLAVSSPELVEGLLVTQFEGESDRGKMSTTGDVIGLSGPFTGLVGTITTTGSAGASARGTYVIELQPSAPSRTPTAPTESISIDYASTSAADSVWQLTDTEFGGAATFTGDVTGSATFRSNDSATTDDLSIVHVCACTLAGVGDGVFVTVLSSPVEGADGTVTWDAEFFGASGAFAGLRGTSTATTVTDDTTGAFAPVSSFKFQLSR